MGMDIIHSLDNIIWIFSDILPWVLYTGTFWLKRETQICESPVPVPTGATAYPQAREEVMICL
jgi:hypothetical protein